jgi:hypothetical protein
VQEAVDSASEGGVIKVVAGTYTGVQVRPRNDTTTGVVTRVVYVSKTVTIQGGYTTSNWTTADPEARATIVDAENQGRVFYVTGAISPTIEGLHIIGGNADLLQGFPPADDAGAGVYVITAAATHFQHWRAWPADIESGQLTSDDVISASADLCGALLFPVGSHAGLNVPDAWDDASSALDFSQAFARSGSTWVANTGYGYGMDEAAALSERLMGDFVAELGTGSEVAVGEALVRAQQRYVNSVAAGSLGLYDEKILIETTLYGLPMARVSVPSPAASTSPVQTRAVEASPLLTAGSLLRRTITVTGSFSEVTTPIGRYHSVDHEVQASGGRPIQPRVSREISEAGTKARSVLFLGGDDRDIAPSDPVIARPVTDTAMTEPSFALQGWYPTEMAAINRVETAFATLERLVVVPGQFRNPRT